MVGAGRMQARDGRTDLAPRAFVHRPPNDNTELKGRANGNPLRDEIAAIERARAPIPRRNRFRHRQSTPDEFGEQAILGECAHACFAGP